MGGPGSTFVVPSYGQFGFPYLTSMAKIAWLEFVAIDEGRKVSAASADDCCKLLG